MRLATKYLRYGLLPLSILTLFAFSIACGHSNHKTVEVRHGSEDSWIGVYVQDLDSELRNYLDYDDRHGVMISGVMDDSPADRAGLKEEDIVVEFDGRRVRNTRDLTRFIERQESGDEVEVAVIRDGEELTLDLRIGEPPSRVYARNWRAPRAPVAPQPPGHFNYNFQFGNKPWLGIQMADLNKDLADYFDVDQRAGVLVLDVIEDSPAEDAGIKAGDVITEIDNRRVRDSEDLQELISERDAGDEIEIEVVRKGDKKKISAELQGSRGYSFRFDRDDARQWKREFRDGIREWRDELRDDLRNLRYDLRDDNIRIDINHDVIRDINRRVRRNIEHIPFIELHGLEDLDFIGEEIERQMEGLHEHLQDMDIRIRINDIKVL